MFFFPSKIYLKAIFYTAKNLHTVHTPTEIKQNLLQWAIFRQSCQVIEHKVSRKISLRSVYLMVTGSKQKIVY